MYMYMYDVYYINCIFFERDVICCIYWSKNWVVEKHFINNDGSKSRTAEDLQAGRGVST